MSLPNDRPLRVRQRLIAASLGIGAYVLSRLLAQMPGVTEAVYGDTLGPLITRPLSLVTGVLPLSVAEWLVVAYIVWLVGRVVGGVQQLRARSRSLTNALAVGGLKLARDGGVAVALFYLLWGFNYSRAPLEDQLGWPAWTDVPVEELESLTSQLVEEGNRIYFEIHGVEDAGAPTATDDIETLHADLRIGWERTVALLELRRAMSKPYGRVKRLLSSPIFARFGITGMYFPFTAEANIRRGLPAITVPKSMGHEQAHQRGIATESAASFLGFFVTTLSPNTLARYSGNLYAQRLFAVALHGLSPEAYERVTAHRYAGIVRDLQHETDYFQQFIGVGTTVGTAVNDRYLRANRVTGGVQNYSHSLRLLITYARLHQGRIAPDVNDSTNGV